MAPLVLERISVKLKHLPSLPDRGPACPGHPDYDRSAPQNSASPDKPRHDVRCDSRPKKFPL